MEVELVNKIALSIDLEDWWSGYTIMASDDALYKTPEEFFSNWKERYDYLTNSTITTLGLLDEHNIKATFFVVADILKYYPGLVEKIAERGHEIACHGLHHVSLFNPHSNRTTFTNEECQRQLLQAKDLLQEAVKQEIIGFRAPMAHFSAEVLDCVENAGFKYDSSVASNSFYNKTNQDLSSINTVPYHPERGSLLSGVYSREILELPWSFFQVFGLRIPTAGAFFLRLLGAHVIAQGLKQSLQKGDTMLYFHAIDLSEENFPAITKSNKRPFYWINQGQSTKRKLDYLCKRFSSRMTTCKEVYERNIKH